MYVATVYYIDKLFIMIIIIQDSQQQTGECGEVNTISEHVAMMVPFYYIPLLLLLMVLVVKLSIKIKTFYKRRYTCSNTYIYVRTHVFILTYVHIVLQCMPIKLIDFGLLCLFSPSNKVSGIGQIDQSGA